MVYQEYVFSFDHNYSVYNIDEGKFVVCDFQVTLLKEKHNNFLKHTQVWNKKWNTSDMRLLKFF